MTNPAIPPRIHVLAKPTGAICNLQCSYCFFLNKEQLYPGSHFRMSDEALETYIRQLIEAHRSPRVTVSWQGGEPTLMGIDFFRRALDFQQKYKRPGMIFENTLQNNGTLFNDEWCEFLWKHKFLVGISIDGPRHLHDLHRHDKQGGPTFDRVMQGLRLLQKHGVEYNILTTVNRDNADHPLEVYRFLRNEAGASWIQFIPAIERLIDGKVTIYQEGTEISERSVTPHQFGNFLITIFDEWVRHDVGMVFVQTFEAAVRNWLGLPSSGMCVFDATRGHGVALEHNGDLYACDHFVEPKIFARQYPANPPAGIGGLRGAAHLRPQQAGSLAPLLPGMRGLVRLQRGMSQEPVCRDPGWRTWSELSLRRVQGLLPPYRPSPENYDLPDAPGTAGRPGNGGSGPGGWL
jgi:uncharacterized protein